MRAIKFRAWIEKCKSMLEGVTVYQTMIGLSDEHFEEDLNPKYEFDGEDVWLKGENSENILNLMTGEEWIFFDDGYVLEQFTGLKDKNGKEIYEGDIIYSPQHNPEKMEVKFIEGGFCMDWGDKEMPIDINHFYPSTGTKIEVVGNIHQSN